MPMKLAEPMRLPAKIGHKYTTVYGVQHKMNESSMNVVRIFNKKKTIQNALKTAVQKN
jgi:hypothetical protein